MAKEQIRLDRVKNAVRITLLAFQAIADQGASEAEILLAKAMINQQLDFELLTRRMVLATIDVEPEGGPDQN